MLPTSNKHRAVTAPPNQTHAVNHVSVANIEKNKASRVGETKQCLGFTPTNDYARTCFARTISPNQLVTILPERAENNIQPTAYAKYTG